MTGRQPVLFSFFIVCKPLMKPNALISKLTIYMYALLMIISPFIAKFKSFWIPCESSATEITKFDLLQMKYLMDAWMT